MEWIIFFPFLIVWFERNTKATPASYLKNYVIYIYIYYVYIVCSLATNMIIHKVHDFVNWFYTSMIGQFGFVEYTSFKYFPIIKKGSNWSFVIKNENDEHMLVANSCKYQDLICMQHMCQLITQSDGMTRWLNVVNNE